MASYLRIKSDLEGQLHEIFSYFFLSHYGTMDLWNPDCPLILFSICRDIHKTNRTYFCGGLSLSLVNQIPGTSDPTESDLNVPNLKSHLANGKFPVL
jgi:hypothetical protein